MLAPLNSQHTADRARLIFFFHIPKTGGTSVKVAFQRVLGVNDTVASYEGVDVPEIELLVRQYAQSSSPRILLGHISPLSLTTGNGFIRTTVVRDPVDHLISFFCYSFQQRYEILTDLEFLRRCARYRDGRFSGDDVERWVERFHRDNSQTRFLSSSYVGPLTARSEQAALDALDSCDVVGTTEELGFYMAILAHLTGVEPPKPTHVNRSAHDIIEEEPDRLRERLKPYVEIDSRIYAHAHERFEVSKQQCDLKLDPAFLHGTGDLTFYERLQSFYRITPQQRRARLSRRLTVLKNYTRDILGVVS
jgi:hypothetical protein